MGTFRMIDETTVECIITEKELDEMGYSIDELLKSGGELAMQLIYELQTMAMENLGDECGEPTGRARVEFCDYKGERVLHGLFEWEPAEEDGPDSSTGLSMDALTDGVDKDQGLSFMLSFEKMDQIIRFVKDFETLFKDKAAEGNDFYTGLSRCGDRLYLIIDSPVYDQKFLTTASLAACEYSGLTVTERAEIAHVCEQGKALITEDAAGWLAELSYIEGDNDDQTGNTQDAY